MIVRSHPRNELKACPGVLPHHGAKAYEFLTGRVPRRDGEPVVVVVRPRPGGREAESTGSEPLSEQTLHLLNLFASGLRSNAIPVHDGAPKGRMTDEETGIRHQSSIEPIEV